MHGSVVELARPNQTSGVHTRIVCLSSVRLKSHCERLQFIRIRCAEFTIVLSPRNPCCITCFVTPPKEASSISVQLEETKLSSSNLATTELRVEVFCFKRFDFCCLSFSFFLHDSSSKVESFNSCFNCLVDAIVAYRWW